MIDLWSGGPWKGVRSLSSYSMLELVWIVRCLAERRRIFGRCQLKSRVAFRFVLQYMNAVELEKYTLSVIYKYQ